MTSKNKEFFARNRKFLIIMLIIFLVGVPLFITSLYFNIKNNTNDWFNTIIIFGGTLGNGIFWYFVGKKSIKMWIADIVTNIILGTSFIFLKDYINAAMYLFVFLIIEFTALIVWKRKGQAQEIVNDFKNKWIYLYICIVVFSLAIGFGLFEYYVINKVHGSSIECVFDGMSAMFSVSGLTLMLIKNKYSNIFAILSYVMYLALFIYKCSIAKDNQELLMDFQQLFNYVLTFVLSSISFYNWIKSKTNIEKI